MSDENVVQMDARRRQDVAVLDVPADLLREPPRRPLRILVLTDPDADIPGAESLFSFVACAEEDSTHLWQFPAQGPERFEVARALHEAALSLVPFVAPGTV